MRCGLFDEVLRELTSFCLSRCANSLSLVDIYDLRSSYVVGML